MEASKFLNKIFAELDEGEHVCVSRAIPKKDDVGVWFKSHLLTDRQWRKWDASKQDQAWYFCVSSINGGLNEKETMVSRSRKNLVRYHCLVLDDIGTKGSPPPVEPSWKLESSKGNFQWGFFLDPGSDWARYEAQLEFCHPQGGGEAGAGGSYRLRRVPGSANLKPGRQMFHAVVIAEDDAVWSLDELAEDMGCNFSKISIEDRPVTKKEGGAAAMEGIDPMLDWLTDNGHIVKDSGGEWVDIICPWADTHTTGENTAGYSPLGRGSGEYVQTRAFNCLHEHCKDKKLSKFREWATKQGAPAVSGYDPLPWLQAKYVYVATGQIVVDILQRPLGGIWDWSLNDWAKDHPGRITPPGRDNPVTVATAFVEHPKTRKVVSTVYRPVPRHIDTGIIHLSDVQQDYVNTYCPPNWAETDEVPQVFLEHINFLIPDEKEREVFLNWLAMKIQRPDLRSYATVMIAEDAYGIGRSWLKDMLSEVLQGGINTASLAQLIGKGTSSEQNFNNWKAYCQFIVVEEAKDSGLTRDEFWNGYETFKQNVDTKVGKAVDVNTKYGRIKKENIYFNALIFTNHADALVLPDDDRRIFCVVNPTTRKDYAYYDRLSGSLVTQEPRRVYWWLMRRDVSGYDRIYPPMTQSKARMIEDNRAPSDAITTWILDNHASDLITKSSLRTAIILAARDLDFDKIMREPGGVLKMIWRKAQTLRPNDVKNGARYLIGGKQTEVRAFRRRDFWLVKDGLREREVVERELGKEKVAFNVVEIRGKEEMT